MKNVKKWRNHFDRYDKYRLAEFLEKQAKEGWILEDSTGAFCFRRGKPRNLHYDIIYNPEATAFDTEPTEAQKTLYDFCSHSGWNLVTTKGCVQVFCNELEDPIPIETDPELELQNIHKLQRAQQKYAYPLYFIGFIQILLAISSLQKGNQTALAFLLEWIVMMLIPLVEWIAYGIWYRKAKRFAASGMAIPRVSSNRIRGIVEGVLLVIAMSVSSNSWRLNPKSIQSMTVILFFFLLFSLGIAKHLTSEKYHGFNGKTKTWAFILIIVGFAVIWAIIIAYITLT